MKEKVYAAIDMGSATIKVVAGSVSNDKVNVYKTAKIRTTANGFKQGQIWDMSEIADNIKKAINEMQKELQVDIKKVSLSIPPRDLKLFQTNGYAKVLNESKVISEKTIEHALESAKNQIDIITYKIIQTKPVSASVDGEPVALNNLIGTSGEELGLSSDVYMIPKNVYEKYKQTLKLAELEISALATSSLAIANEVVIGSTSNAAIVDIGHHSTTVSLFFQNKLFKTHIIPMAGKHITHDINKLMKLDSYKIASTFKHKYVKLGVKNNTTIHFDDYGQKYDITYLNKIATRRTLNILKQVKEFTDLSFMNTEVDFILTGGSGALHNLEKLAQHVLKNPVRVYSPTTIGANTPDFTTTIGMIYLTDQYYKNKSSNIIVEGLDTTKWFETKTKFTLSKIFSKLKRSKG